MKHLRITGALCTLSIVLGSIPAVTFGTSAQASVQIEQLSPKEVGVWTMLSSNEAVRTSNDNNVNANNYSFGITDYGPTTLSVVPPLGMSARIQVYRGGEKVAQTDSQQYSFNIYANDNYRFVIQYSLTKLGSLGVTSEPSDVRFRMRASNGRTYAGKTPATFTNIPTGRYTLIFPGVNGCTEASRKNTIVEGDTRNTLNVSLASCTPDEDEVSIDRSRLSKRTLREMAEQRELKPRGERK